MRFWGVLLGLWFMGGAQLGAQPTLIFTVPVPAMALVDVEPEGDNHITLTLTTPAEAGQAMNNSTATDNSLWLNYTSSITQGGSHRSVYVQASGTLPSGIRLTVTASPRSSAGGKGAFGLAATTPVTINNAPQLLISDIGGCHTGDGTGFGHQLLFSADLNGEEFDEPTENTVIQVSYTITDH